jgi:hypothetical protein
MYMVFYLMLALLSVTAGLGFSITITARTVASQSISLATMQAQYKTLTEQMEKISTKELEISELNKSSGITIDSYEPFIQANQRYQEAEAAYIQANNAYRSAMGSRSGLTDGTPEFVAAQSEINRTNQLLSAATTARSLTKAEADRVKANFNDFQTNSEFVVKRLNDELIVYNEELQLLISQVGLMSKIGSVALLELDNMIREEENRNIIEKGMAFMFEEFAKYLHTTPETVKLFILLFVAILIELTIWQCSPDIRISRRVLYFFRNSLPADVDVKDILEKFDEENKQFEDIKEIVEAPPPPPPPVPELVAPKRKTKRKRVKKPADIVEAEHLAVGWPLNPAEPVVLPEEIALPEEGEEMEEEVKPEPPKDVKSIHYRFGRTTETVKNEFVKFVRNVITDIGEFAKDPSIAASEMALNFKAKDVFLNRLLVMKMDNKFLIQEKEGVYYSNFPVEDIINYSTEIIND